MLYKFKAKNTGDVIMLESNGRQVLEIIGKAPGPQGIILTSDIPLALDALRAAITHDEHAEQVRQQQQQAERKAHGTKDDDVAKPPGVSLRHRALPFMQMLETCHLQGDDIVWGV